MRTGEILAAIESKAEWIAEDGRQLAEFIARLPVQRNFLTKAEAAMDDAEKALIEALKIVRTSRMAYLNKPKELNRENIEGVSV